MPEREPATAPIFSDFEAVYLRGMLAQPPYRVVWLQTLLQLPGVRRVFLLDLSDAKVVLAAPEDRAEAYGSSSACLGCSGQVTGMFGSFLSQCWKVIFEYARILAAGEPAGGGSSSSQGDSKGEVLCMAFPAGTADGPGPTSELLLCLHAVRLVRPACLVALYQHPTTDLPVQRGGQDPLPKQTSVAPDLEATLAGSDRRHRAKQAAKAALQAQAQVDSLPPRFRTQKEVLRRLRYPSSFSLFKVSTYPSAYRACLLRRGAANLEHRALLRTPVMQVPPRR
jgi:hypothetical protein